MCSVYWQYWLYHPLIPTKRLNLWPPKAVAMASLRQTSPHRSLLLIHQSSNNVHFHESQLCLRSRMRPAALAARSSGATGREKLLEDRIKEELLNAGEPSQSPSSYDTAWAAMVPAPEGSSSRFPRCVDWILRNQNADGSWGPGGCSGDPSLGKDALSSTMACVLALRTWGVGDELVGKGLFNCFMAIIDHE